MSSFQTVKIVLVDTTGLAKDALHIYVALIIFLGSCLVFGWKARDWKPWLLVLLAASAGEVWDIYDMLPTKPGPDYFESAKDIVNTLMVPTMLMFAARYSGIFRKD